MRRCLALAVAAGLLAPSGASAFPNGRASSSGLAPVYIPGNRASLAREGAAAWNTMRLCAVTSGVDLYPGPSSATPARTAYRDYTGQLYVWSLYQAGRGSLAAFPGTSNHGTGRAVDLALVRMRLYVDNHGAAFGWRKIEAPGEWWHVNYVGGFHRPNPGTSQRYPVLARGSGGRCQGAAVREAQRRLGVGQDGEYGRATKDAVVRYQRSHRLRVSGVIGRATWDRLRAISRGVRSPQVLRLVQSRQPVVGIDVKAIQGLLNARLTELGRTRYRVRIDGVLGATTIQAVRRFQSLRRLPVNGKVQARTIAALRVPYVHPQTGQRWAYVARFIAGFEGGQSSDGLFHPYRDVVGVRTIGYGHTEGVSLSDRPLTKVQATALLARDLDRKYAPAVLRLRLPLNQHQTEALVSLVYNLGPGVLEPGRSMGDALRRHDSRGAAGAFGLYVYAGGRRLLGLVRRRETERRLFLLPVGR